MNGIVDERSFPLHRNLSSITLAALSELPLPMRFCCQGGEDCSARNLLSLVASILHHKTWAAGPGFQRLHGCHSDETDTPSSLSFLASLP